MTATAPTANGTANGPSPSEVPVRVSKAVRAAKYLNKGLKFFVLTFLVLVLLVQAIKCLTKFCEYPTFISTYIAKQQDAEFPVVTVCPRNTSYKKDVLRVGRWKM